MRQNPMLSSRVQVGGRPMPSWFSASLVNQSRTSLSTPPPLPAEPPPSEPSESEYEEIDHLHNPGGRKSSGKKRNTCSLCGNPNPVVSCEMCDNQIFCGSCNDMYHRHPKRLHHNRKILESLEGRPPLPPKSFMPPPVQQEEFPPPLPPQAPVTSALPPVPPPRKNKSRFGLRSATSSPSITRKALFDPVGSIKRFVGGMAHRPLPPPPKPAPPLPPKSAAVRAMTPVGGQSASSGFDRRHSSPAPHVIPGMYPSDRTRTLTMHDMHMQNGRNQSISVANINDQFGSRDNGFIDWEEEEDFFARQRAHSISTPHGARFPNSHDASHFATLQRNRRGFQQNTAPERPPPPIPPRSASSSQTHLGFQSSQSVFNLNQMGMPHHQPFSSNANNMPWNYPGHGYPPYDFQQQQQQQAAMMMGYPGTMRRTPSNSSMGGGPMPPHFFPWGPMGFGPPMSQQEMEREVFASRRGSEPPVFANNQRASSISQPVTPQGSFRKKTRPSLNQERQQAAVEARINERFIQTNNNLSQQNRSTTPSSFVRVKPIIPQDSLGGPMMMNQNNAGGRYTSSHRTTNNDEDIDDNGDDDDRDFANNNAEDELEGPEGPWTCEHCTFINPKSTKICTICCKTPSDGYKSMNKSGFNNTKSPTSSSSSFGRNNKGSAEESGSEIHEEIPILESKLSISRGEKQQATINLVERVEKVRTPTDSSQHRLSKQGMRRSGAGPRTPVPPPPPEEEEEDDDDNDENVDEEHDEDALEQNLERHAQHHQIKINTKKQTNKAAGMSNSNEDVYGSIPIQTLTISPKIDIGSRRPSKSVTSTGVGSSPPKSQDISKEKASSSTPSSILVTKKYTKSSKDKKVSPSNSVKSKSSSNEIVEGSARHSSSGASSSPEQTTKMENTKKTSTVEIGKSNASSSAATAATSIKPKTLSVSTGVQADTGESGNESNRSVTSSSSKSSGRSSELVSSASERKVKSESSFAEKESKGTSPPPQTISTQTYEDLPASSMRRKSASKLSMASMQSLQSDDFAPPKPVEMSEKAMRYARKAQHHHQAKLKRSMSTHLTSASEPWVDLADGRNLYRSSSRHSLYSDTRSLPMSGPPSRDTSPPPNHRGSSRFYEDIKRFQQPPSWDRFPTPEDYFASFEDLVSRRGRRDSVRSQEFELTRLLKDAEEFNYTPEDIQVALRMCGDRNPIKWLQENWSSMIETVQTLATKYGREKGQDNNQIGSVSSFEAKEALRSHKGNVWAAVTECVEQRRKKFLELQSRGTFLREEILSALTASQGNVDAAYLELSKAQLKPFLMRIWGPPSGLDNDAVPPSPIVKNFEIEKVELSLSQKDEISPQANTPSESDRQPQTITSHEEVSVSSGSNSSNAPSTSIIAKELALGELEPDPKLEILVSSAAKVTQEIERAIQELKMSKSKQQQTQQNELNEKIDPNEIKKEEVGESTSISVESDANNLSRSRILEEGVASPTSLTVKSDEGEDESFADAVSDSEVGLMNREGRSGNVAVDEDLIRDYPEDEEYDEDVLEIEIDDTEVSDFIQNYEVVPPNPVVQQEEQQPLLTTGGGSADELETSKVDATYHDERVSSKETNRFPEDQPVSSTESEQKADGQEENEIELLATGQVQSTIAQVLENKEQANGNEQEQATSSSSSGITSETFGNQEKSSHLSPTELEHLLSTLTSTFTEMGQFANEIKEKIATEIQQQLAAAVATSSKVTTDNTASSDATELPTGEILYEPVTLPDSINENVNKKIAKYKRLAAKKLQKSNRHKSPESRALSRSVKEPSASPSPASSTNDLVRNRQDEVPETGESSAESPAAADGTAVVDSPTLQHPVSPNYIDAEIEITGNEIEGRREDENNGESSGESDGHVNAYDIIDVDRDEGEYDSGSDSSYEEQEVEEGEGQEVDEEEEEVSEEESEIEESEEEEMEESSGGEEEAEVAQVFENDEESRGAEYEEVEISHSSDYDLYSNKDTDKIIINSAQTNKITFATPTAEPIFGDDLLPINSDNLEGASSAHESLGTTSILNEIEKKIAKLVGAGKTVENTEKAELAKKLIDMNFGEDDSIYAASECSSLYAALSFLQQECDLCAGKFSARQMVSMLRCTHVCCQNCAKEYFTVQVRDKSIVDATCPFCSEPSNLTEDAEMATDYFNHLDILLKSLLEPRLHEMFQRKLRDWALAQTPNFKWCSKCSSGFITEPLQTRLICPDCNAVTCAICLEQWDKFNHDHRESKVKVCDSASKSIVDYLNENCVECPRCHFRFSLARGGCMHLTCSQCRHEFCSGCSAPFKMGEKCEAKLPICDRLGLHAHHPRNCLFYLRDKEPEILAKLLEENAIPYLKEDSGTSIISAESSQRICQVPIQKETSEGLKDDVCGKEAPAGFATVCKAYKKHPGRPYPTSDEDFRKRLLKVINEEIPL